MTCGKVFLGARGVCPLLFKTAVDFANVEGATLTPEKKALVVKSEGGGFVIAVAFSEMARCWPIGTSFTVPAFPGLFLFCCDFFGVFGVLAFDLSVTSLAGREEASSGVFDDEDTENQGEYLTIIPRAQMGYESTAHEAEGRMDY